MRLISDGQPIDFLEGDSIALAMLRSGEVPNAGGALCLAGDCGNCVATVDGVSWVRTCQTLARPAMVVQRHPNPGAPSMYVSVGPNEIGIEHRHHDVVIVGAGPAGVAAAREQRANSHDVVVFDANAARCAHGTAEHAEVVALYAGPMLVVRSGASMLHIHAHQVVLATGAADLLPVCEGNHLSGLLTSGAFHQTRAAGIDHGRVIVVGDAIAGCEHLDGRLIRFVGDSSHRVTTVVTDLGERQADTVVVNLGQSPRDVLARMATAKSISVVGAAADAYPLPEAPIDGIVCACSKVTVEDLRGVWDRGFQEVELIKRSSLCGTGTCQGSACMPHLRAFVASQTTDESLSAPFTARPASRQITMREAAAGFWPDPWKRTPLHDEHLKLGANMDRFGGWWRPWNYGDHVGEYWAVREAVSLGDVSTLGKLVVTGLDAVEFLERVYPTTIADIKVGRSRYVLLLNERGHLFDDGMVLREDDHLGLPRFVLTFTSGGASNAEAWMRDWAETWNLDVRIMDRTTSLAAINVTGPLGAELLRRCGVVDTPKFLQHRHLDVAGVPCHVMRLSFTGEASWELHHPWSRSVELWTALLAAGADLGIKPHGLQALFGLRLEKGHIIVGMDTELDTTPRRIDHDWAVKMGKPFFLGKDSLVRTGNPELVAGDMRKLVPLQMDGVAPTEGSPLYAADGTTLVGHVATSFTSPLLGHAIMLAMLKRSWNPALGIPEMYTVDGRTAHLSEVPFYDKEGSRARA